MSAPAINPNHAHVGHDDWYMYVSSRESCVDVLEVVFDVRDRHLEEVAAVGRYGMTKRCTAVCMFDLTSLRMRGSGFSALKSVATTRGRYM